jgi:hypothetical protein
MLNRNGRAILTAALVADRRAPVIDRLFAARSADGAIAAPAPPLFPRKCAAAHAAHRRAAPLVPMQGRRPRLSVRLTQEQLWRTRLAAAFMRQSCQAFLADALDRHVAAVACDPAHGALGALLDGAPAANG